MKRVVVSLATRLNDGVEVTFSAPVYKCALAAVFPRALLAMLFIPIAPLRHMVVGRLR